MVALENFRAGRLEDALSEQQAAVRKNPASVQDRIFLFQLLAVSGQWDRARTQLDTAAQLDASVGPLALVYRPVLEAEAFRSAVFSGKRAPLVLGEPEHWVALLIEALRLAGLGHQSEAADLRKQALEATPALPGNVDGTPFVWMIDSDCRLGACFEAVLNGSYYWIPLERIRRMSLDAPADVRDLLWAPASLTLANGGELPAFIPTRYVGSESSSDPQIRLARRTEWSSPDDAGSIGLGQRVLATDAGDFALLDIRQLDLAPEATADGRTAASEES